MNTNCPYCNSDKFHLKEIRKEAEFLRSIFYCCDCHNEDWRPVEDATLILIAQEKRINPNGTRVGVLH